MQTKWQKKNENENEKSELYVNTAYIILNTDRRTFFNVCVSDVKAFHLEI